MRNRLFLVALTVATLVALPAGIAHANNGDPSSAALTPPASNGGHAARGDDSIVFYGSGWGHGVGMSQWGSQGLALKGWNYKDILTHYYSNTTVGTSPANTPDQIRVGLTWARSSLHLGAVNGKVALRFGSPSGPDKYTIPNGSTWSVGIDPNGHFLITNANGHTYPPTGGPQWRMFATYVQNGARVRIAEAGHTYGRGVVEFNSYKVGSTRAIRAIAVLDPNQYLYGLGEVPNYWEMDALEVQAVAGRTYAFNVIKSRGGARYSDCNCDLYPDARSQSYFGSDKETDQLGDRWVQAVNQTAGQVILYQGDLILANYYSSSGGYTENVENVWFGNAIPYLRAVCDPGDYTAPEGLRTWVESLSRQQVGQALGVGTLSSFSGVTRSTNSGRIISITANGSGGLRGSSNKMSGPQFSSALGLMDDKVWINANLNIVGSIRHEYDSLMCEPGLAASSAFKAGGGTVQRFAHGSIYVNPAAGATSWLHGGILDKYQLIGGAGGILGLPRLGVVRLAVPHGCHEAVCSKAEFDHGKIYDKGPAAAHEIHGKVLTYYLKTGGANGVLGFPTSDVKHLAQGTTQSTFEHGTVTCPASGRCTRG